MVLPCPPSRPRRVIPPDYAYTTRYISLRARKIIIGNEGQEAMSQAVASADNELGTEEPAAAIKAAPVLAESAITSAKDVRKP